MPGSSPSVCSTTRWHEVSKTAATGRYITSSARRATDLYTSSSFPPGKTPTQPACNQNSTAASVVARVISPAWDAPVIMLLLPPLSFWKTRRDAPVHEIPVLDTGVLVPPQDKVPIPFLARNVLKPAALVVRGARDLRIIFHDVVLNPFVEPEQVVNLA